MEQALSGSRFVPSRSLWLAGAAMAAYFALTPAFSWSLAHGLVYGSPSWWPFAAAGSALALLGLLLLFSRLIARYMAWDRPRARLGLPPAPAQPRLRDSMRLNWGMMGRQPERVVEVLDKISGRTGPIPEAARAEVPALARLLWRRMALDMALAIVGGAALSVLFIATDPGMWALLVLMGVAMPLSLFLNATRYQDPWLAWYRRHLLG